MLLELAFKVESVCSKVDEEEYEKAITECKRKPTWLSYVEQRRRTLYC